MARPDSSQSSGDRDLLYELHEEECAHGSTLMQLARLRDALTDITQAQNITDAWLIAGNALRGAPWKGDDA